MSASDPSKAILLTDEPNQVKKKVNKHAFSGGRETLEEHREKGGDCSIDVAYQWLYNIFEEDEEIECKLDLGDRKKTETFDENDDRDDMSFDGRFDDSIEVECGLDNLKPKPWD